MKYVFESIVINGDISSIKLPFFFAVSFVLKKYDKLQISNSMQFNDEQRILVNVAQFIISLILFPLMRKSCAIFFACCFCCNEKKVEIHNKKRRLTICSPSLFKYFKSSEVDSTEFHWEQAVGLIKNSGFYKNRATNENSKKNCPFMMLHQCVTAITFWLLFILHRNKVKRNG